MSRCWLVSWCWFPGRCLRSGRCEARRPGRESALRSPPRRCGAADAAQWPERTGRPAMACPDGLPSGAADHGAEACGGRPPAAPCRPPVIPVECSGAKLPKTAAAATPASPADNAMAKARRSLSRAARIARCPPACPVRIPRPVRRSAGRCRSLAGADLLAGAGAGHAEAERVAAVRDHSAVQVDPRRAIVAGVLQQQQALWSLRARAPTVATLCPARHVSRPSLIPRLSPG